MKVDFIILTFNILFLTVFTSLMWGVSTASKVGRFTPSLFLKGFQGIIVKKSPVKELLFIFFIFIIMTLVSVAYTSSLVPIFILPLLFLIPELISKNTYSINLLSILLISVYSGLFEKNPWILFTIFFLLVSKKLIELEGKLFLVFSSLLAVYTYCLSTEINIKYIDTSYLTMLVLVIIPMFYFFVSNFFESIPFQKEKKSERLSLVILIFAFIIEGALL